MTGSEELLRLQLSLRVLALAGLTPNLDACGRCGRPAPASRAALFDPQLGSLVCRACGGGPIKLSGDLRARMQRACTEAWDQLDPALDPEELESFGRALDEFLARHHGRRLKAGDVARQLENRRSE